MGSSTSIQERRGLFWVRHEHLFPAKNRQNRKFYNRLTTRDMLRVFMGSTTTSTRTISGKRSSSRKIFSSSIWIETAHPTIDLGRMATAQKIAKITKNGRLSAGSSS